ncbi:30S ribosomal protein S3 [Candidatus Nesciobacter abundans]|uniref:Small ribosomal subunit protein uS3 n=1 Tax=Candidatus Nesciobacter abundans TaxID=2601668 RepID=A0A5C0UGS8_9PROT|nr:30S ribosomal protein S3 [Candidatus Nesciobacter abundans]QEK38907.1 30S ribosomal protein S3 [Candidatus Nesciobacter abundans]
MGNKSPWFRIRSGSFLSQWYPSKKSADYVVSDYKIRSLILKNKYWEVSEIFISRVESKINIDIRSAKPGSIIGKQGSSLSVLKDKISNIFDKKFDISIQVTPVKDSEKDAQIIASRIASEMEKRRSYKAAAKRAVQDALRSSKGIKIKCSGRLGGAEIARDFKLSSGSVPANTIRADIRYGFAEANTNSGKCGVKVWVNLGLEEKKNVS